MESIKVIPVCFYRDDSGNEPVRTWLKSLSDEDRRIIGTNLRRIQIDWPIGTPLVKSLGRGGLWELRSSLDNRISRVLFVFHDGTIVLIHAFIKKTQAIPKKEIDLAERRAKNL